MKYNQETVWDREPVWDRVTIGWAEIALSEEIGGEDKVDDSVVCKGDKWGDEVCRRNHYPKVEKTGFTTRILCKDEQEFNFFMFQEIDQRK